MACYKLSFLVEADSIEEAYKRVEEKLADPEGVVEFFGSVVPSDRSIKSIQ